MTATDELRCLLDEHDEYYKTSGNKTWWGRPIDRQTGKPINVFHYRAQPMGEDRLFVELQLATPEQAVAATVGRDERESYDAGFASGIKATLQQLYGLLHEYPTLDEIEAWADNQWEEYE